MANGFWKRWGFPLAVVAIDGKHVAVKCPRKSGSLFFNYKKYFSIVLLAAADAQYSFVFVDVGGCGREGDAGLFSRWSFGQAMQNPMETYEDGGMCLPPDNYIPGTNIKVPHVVLGILTSRFRIMDGRINLEPKAADNVVKACVVLHNYLKAHDANDYAEPRYNMPAEFVDYRNANGEIVEGAWRRELQDHQNYARLLVDQDENPARVAYDVRDRFKNYFISDIGKLPWQDKYVREGRY